MDGIKIRWWHDGPNLCRVKKVDVSSKYILEWSLLEKKCKTAILLYCFHTAGVLHIFVLYNLLGPGTTFYRKSKINIKRNPNYEIGWFHNWPMTFIENIFRSGLTLVSSNDIITKKDLCCQINIGETNSWIMRWKKDNLQIFTLKKCFKTIIIAWDRLKTNCLDVCV